MRRLLSSALIAALIVACGCSPQGAKTETSAPAAAAAATPYGSNKAASGTFVHDGVTLYYEVYGEGEPLLLVHGNGGSIAMMAGLIEGLKAHHKVIAMDSRDQGRSSDSEGALTYEKMTDDLAALVDHLKLGAVDVVGWSDGGIEALLMGARHPDKVRKLVAMAANLQPDGVYPETDALVKQMLGAITPEMRKTPQGKRDVKVASIMLTEPHINAALLAKVTAPTLVLSGDHDLIRLDHTVRIYESLPNAQLAVFPNSTHMIPYDDPGAFIATVERFLTTPFKKKDRIADTMASYEKMMGAAAAPATPAAK